MSNISKYSSMARSNIVFQSVNLTDDVKINLEYDIHKGLLNVFVKNIFYDEDNKWPCQINLLSNKSNEYQLLTNIENDDFTPLEIEQNQNEIFFDDQTNICYEISTNYYYDIVDENENLNETEFNQTRISLSPFSSYNDDPTFDNDDGYSTHSLDDIEQQNLSLAVPLSKQIQPSFSSQHRCYYHYYSEQYVTPIRRLIEQLTWLSPFKTTVQRMMMSHFFH